jgi:hypothetical protein
MNKFGGIDLNTNKSVIAVSHDADRIVYQRRLSNDPVQIRASLAPHFEGRVGMVTRMQVFDERRYRSVTISS